MLFYTTNIYKRSYGTKHRLKKRKITNKNIQNKNLFHLCKFSEFMIEKSRFVRYFLANE